MRVNVICPTCKEKFASFEYEGDEITTIKQESVMIDEKWKSKTEDILKDEQMNCPSCKYSFRWQDMFILVFSQLFPGVLEKNISEIQSKRPNIDTSRLIEYFFKKVGKR